MYIKEAKPSYEHNSLAREILYLKDLPYEENYTKILSYFLRYGYLPLHSFSIQEAAKNLSSAPWLRIEDETAKQIVEFLIKKRILEFSIIEELGDAPVLKLSDTLNTENEKTNYHLHSCREEISHDIESRMNICKIIGWTNSIQNQNVIDNAFFNFPDGATMKLMAYHGVTWHCQDLGFFNKIVNSAQINKNSKYEILIVDEKSTGKVIEGATKEEHNMASLKGLRLLKNNKELGKNILKRIDVRTYGIRDSDSLLRCLIIESKQKKILGCYVTVWFFGCERGFYGKQLFFDGDSNIALLFRDYFNSVFNKGWPRLGLWKKIEWIIHSNSHEIITIGVALIIGILWLVFSYERISSKEANITTTLGLIGSLIIGLLIEKIKHKSI